MKICPNCGYERQQKDEGMIPETECPKCGIIYDKIEKQKNDKRTTIIPTQKLKIDIMRFFQIKHVILTMVIIICLSISYYFFIALPNYNTAKLETEKDKIEMEKQKENLRSLMEGEKERQRLEMEREKTERVEINKRIARSGLFDCRAQVVARANRYKELNCTPVPGQQGVITTTRVDRDEINRIYTQGYDDCQRMYGSEGAR